MSAGQFVGRVGGIAAALGVGIAIFGSTSVAAADTAGPDARGSAVASAESSPAPARGSRGATVVKLDAHGASVRSRSSAAAAIAVPRVSTLPAPASNTVTLPTRAVTAPTASVVVQPSPTYATTPPNPQSTTFTSYGLLGQWMINKAGQVADWVGTPYCGKGSTSANCKADTPGAKTIQEPINTIFVVKATNLYQAELQLNWSLVVSGFGPSPFSSIGYSGIVGSKTFKQSPRGGPLGLGYLLPMPFGLFQNGLLGSLAGIGPAYRDAPFFLANSHLRTFGGESDGKGNFTFTASVSEENLDATGSGLLPTHGYESFNQARQKLLDKMLKASWISFASNQGLVAMNNAINPNDPKYTTGDADGLAQVIAIGSLFGNATVRSSATTRVA